MYKNKKQRREAKRIKILSRKILKKYPFLRLRNVWTDKKMDKLPEIFPFDDGWMKCFFYQMMDEIKADLTRTFCLNTFRSDQYKEKFGSLHWYVHGCERSTQEIISKYSIISNNVCYYCGRPDVGYYNTGWILPICKCCYEKNKYHTIPYEEAINMNVCTIQNEYSYRRFNKENDNFITITVDISDTVNKIRERWKK